MAAVQILHFPSGDAPTAVAMLPSVDNPPHPTHKDAEVFLLPAKHVQVAAFVPLYTEDAHTLKRTLENLAMQQEDLRKCFRAYQTVRDDELQGATNDKKLHIDIFTDTEVFEPTLHVFVVADGIEKVSQSMAAYLAELFPGFSEDFFVRWRNDEPIVPGATVLPSTATSPKEAMPRAAVFHRVTPLPHDRMSPPDEVSYQVAPIEIDLSWVLQSKARESDRTVLLQDADYDGESAGHVAAHVRRPLYVTLLVKERNRKKHNSQRWFFDLFAKMCTKKCGTQYYFATDCGTTYSPHLMCDLVGHMAKHPNCGACCGHQRIMPYADQVDPAQRRGKEPWSMWALRCIQGADFDQGLCVFNGVHSKLGFLPVIPGPCGLFRASCITDDTLDRMNAVCTNPADEDGLVQGNLKLAEDRILSYLIILRATSEAAATTDWVPTAVFYFEAEESLGELVLQRRRWLNGTIMGYPWLLRRKELWGSMMHASGARAFQAIAMFLLCLVQLLVFAIVSILPAFIGIVGHLTIMSLDVLLRFSGGSSSPAALAAVIQLYWVIYGGTWLALVGTARLCRTPYFPHLWKIRTGINASIIIVNAISMISMFLISVIAPDRFVEVAGDVPSKNFQVAFSAGLLYLSTPFALALMHSREAFVSLARKFYIYYAFLPTIVVDFMSYSLSRLDDWTWGNKERANNARALSTTVDTQKQSTDTSKTLRKTRILAKAIPVVVVVMNCIITGVVIFYALVNNHALIIIGGLFEAVGLSIMACAAIYFVMRFLRRPVMTLTAFTAWLACLAACVGIIYVYDRANSMYTFFVNMFFISAAVLWGLAFLEAIHDKLCVAAENTVKEYHADRDHITAIAASLRVQVSMVGDGIAIQGVHNTVTEKKVKWWMIVLTVIAFPISPILLLITFTTYTLRQQLTILGKLCACRRQKHRRGASSKSVHGRQFSGTAYHIPTVSSPEILNAGETKHSIIAGAGSGVEESKLAAHSMHHPTHHYLNSTHTVVVRNGTLAGSQLIEMVRSPDEPIVERFVFEEQEEAEIAAAKGDHDRHISRHELPLTTPVRPLHNAHTTSVPPQRTAAQSHVQIDLASPVDAIILSPTSGQFLRAFSRASGASNQLPTQQQLHHKPSMSAESLPMPPVAFQHQLQHNQSPSLEAPLMPLPESNHHAPHETSISSLPASVPLVTQAPAHTHVRTRTPIELSAAPAAAPEDQCSVTVSAHRAHSMSYRVISGAHEPSVSMTVRSTPPTAPPRRLASMPLPGIAMRQPSFLTEGDANGSRERHTRSPLPMSVKRGGSPPPPPPTPLPPPAMAPHAMPPPPPPIPAPSTAAMNVTASHLNTTAYPKVTRTQSGSQLVKGSSVAHHGVSKTAYYHPHTADVARYHRAVTSTPALMRAAMADANAHEENRPSMQAEVDTSSPQQLDKSAETHIRNNSRLSVSGAHAGMDGTQWSNTRPPFSHNSSRSRHASNASSSCVQSVVTSPTVHYSEQPSMIVHPAEESDSMTYLQTSATQPETSETGEMYLLRHQTQTPVSVSMSAHARYATPEQFSGAHHLSRTMYERPRSTDADHGHQRVMSLPIQMPAAADMPAMRHRAASVASSTFTAAETVHTADTLLQFNTPRIPEEPPTSPGVETRESSAWVGEPVQPMPVDVNAARMDGGYVLRDLPFQSRSVLAALASIETPGHAADAVKAPTAMQVLGVHHSRAASSQQTSTTYSWNEGTPRQEFSSTLVRSASLSNVQNSQQRKAVEADMRTSQAISSPTDAVASTNNRETVVSPARAPVFSPSSSGRTVTTPQSEGRKADAHGASVPNMQHGHSMSAPQSRVFPSAFVRHRSMPTVTGSADIRLTSTARAQPSTSSPMAIPSDTTFVSMQATISPATQRDEALPTSISRFDLVEAHGVDDRVDVSRYGYHTDATRREM